MALGACNAITGDAFDVTLVQDAGEIADASVPDAARDASASDGNVGTADSSDGAPVNDARGGADSADAAGSPMISARAASTCAVAGGGVKCWGSDDHDQLGDTSMTARSSAAYVPALATGVASVSVGTSHACAVLLDGGAVCWGSNADGQLGSSAGAGPFPAPVTVPLSKKASVIAAGETSTCAILEDETVACWGGNADGQLGAGTQAPAMSSTPLAVAGIATARSLAAGELHFCAVLDDATLWCWGWNHWGQIGDGDIDDRYAPFMAATEVSAVALGDMHTCALTTGGGLSCWGANNAGQLGDGSTTQHQSPAQTMPAYTKGVTAIAAGSTHTCAVAQTEATNAGVHCWGEDSSGQLGNGVFTGTFLMPPAAEVSPLGGAILSLAAGGNHSCVLVGGAGGGAFCWGENGDGQLGDGTMSDQATVRTVGGLF